ncbi:hypothetical protein [Flavobacterium psychrolimnae]|nr:hypothetical protein [Flavobacterium psychrolimnae]
MTHNVVALDEFGNQLIIIPGFAKSSQVQNQLSIKPIAQIRFSGCYQQFL